MTEDRLDWYISMWCLSMGKSPVDLHYPDRSTAHLKESAPRYVYIEDLEDKVDEQCVEAFDAVIESLKPNYKAVFYSEYLGSKCSFPYTPNDVAFVRYSILLICSKRKME